jgi:HAD domain in Swiss Army Knife RNA repair proteins
VRKTGKPILFVDVDGVISLFGFAADARPEGSFHTVDGIPHLLSARAGEYLRALAPHFELVWCTGWEDKANEYLPHLLELPGPLPFLTFDPPMGSRSAHWKLVAVTEFAGDRPLAWVDDAFNDECHTWAADREAPTLLLRTDPPVGLTDEIVEALSEWAAGLDGTSRPDLRRGL